MMTKLVKEQIQNLEKGTMFDKMIVKLSIIGSSNFIPQDILNLMTLDVLRWNEQKKNASLEAADKLLDLMLAATDLEKNKFPYKTCKKCKTFKECFKVIESIRQSHLNTTGISIEKLASVIGEC